MFDTKNYINKTTKNYSPERIDVHEHKAPTDESIKLLNEFQEKAKLNLIKTVYVSDNIFEGAIMYFMDEVNFARAEICFKFKLNQQEYTFKEFINREDLSKELHEMSIWSENEHQTALQWCLQCFYQTISKKFIEHTHQLIYRTPLVTK